MVTLEIFLFGLLGTSVFTGLFTEAIKNMMTEYNKTYRANTLAGIVSLVLSVAISVGYVLLTNTAFTSQIIVCIVALVLLSWLCAMVGYDKVIQAISQIKTYGKDDSNG